MTKCYFVTGTDTKVGKTTASIALLQEANLAGCTTAGYKPVASGAIRTTEGLRNNDALALQFNSNVVLSYEMVNPYIFCEPISPHIASFYESRPILFAVLSTGLRQLKSKVKLTIVEGAGGWFTPLTNVATFADWVISEQLPVIMVVDIKLGCINHALLTAFAIQQAKLNLVGWIANNITVPDKWHAEYLVTLKRLLPAIFIGEIPCFTELKQDTTLSGYLDLECLDI